MPNNSPPPGSSLEPGRPSKAARYAAWFVGASAVIYGLLAGLHTLQDFDLWWQLATGRWVVQHHQIFSTDIFSYTAHGAPWIYPVFSGIVFYLAYLAGGYAALSWMGAVACAGTIALLIRRKSIASSALALIAVPLIANRTQPRAEMFTTILFAAFVSLLWRHYRTGEQSGRRSPIWLLPLLMVAWVNLHLGFVAGLALCAAYVLCELTELLRAANHTAARIRLQRAWPWLALTAVATLVNPWGVFIYRALARQQQAQNLHNTWVVEWENIRPSWTSLRQAIDWRDPQSSFWWLLAIALICAGIALWRKHWGAAILLLGSAYLTLQHVRFQALFACIAVVVGGSLLDDAWLTARMNDDKALAAAKRRNKEKAQLQQQNHAAWGAGGLVLVIALLTGLAVVRSTDLITNRYYLRSSQLSLFGTGLSWWFPQRALDFIQREKLPANIFNGYALGGYLTWWLFPDYLDYIDGRAVPFGSELFFQAYDLSVEPPESPAWQREAEARDINTIVVSLARYDGIALFPQLRAFCRSQGQNEGWRPVYMDDVSAVFVRRTEQTALLVDRLQIDCDKVSFAPPAEVQAAGSYRHSSSRSAAESFSFLANSAEILYRLGRYQEATADLDRAQAIFSGNANLHWIHGLLLEHAGRASEAEAEFLTSLKIEPKAETSTVLGLFYMSQKRYGDAAALFRQSAETSTRPHDMWMLLGQADLMMNRPQPALEALDKAEASSPFRDGGETLGTNFNSMVATSRAKAWYQLGDLPRAVSYQEEAAKLSPHDSKLWLGLADLYQAQGRTAEAGQARLRAAGR
jgi:tetratricopeptide (TPR) repeat protein